MFFELHYELLIVFSLFCLQPFPNKIGTMEQKVKISHELIKLYNSSEFRESTHLDAITGNYHAVIYITSIIQLWGF